MSTSMYIQNSDKFYKRVLKIVSGNKILAYIKGHNSGTYLRKMTYYPKLDLVNMNSYIKFGENLSICSVDFDQKQNFVLNQGP